jgi:hypothetical protein
MKKEMKFVRGDTDEKKFEFINMMLTRLARKSFKVSVGIVPPVPISSYVREVPKDEGVFRFIFPVSGKVVGGVIRIDEFPQKKEIPFIVVIRALGGKITRELNVRNGFLKVGLDLPVEVGDTVEILNDWFEEVKGVWIGILFQPEVSSADVKQIMAEEFDKLEDKYTSEDEEE